MQTLKPALLMALMAFLLAGCALFGKRETTTLRIHEQVSGALPDSRVLAVTLPTSGLNLSVNPYPALSEKDVQTAELFPTAGGDAIMLRLDIHGTIVLDEITTRGRGQYLVAMLDGRPVAAWLIADRIINGQLLLEGDFTDAHAQRVVDELNRMSKKRR